MHILLPFLYLYCLIISLYSRRDYSISPSGINEVFKINVYILCPQKERRYLLYECELMNELKSYIALCFYYLLSVSKI